MRKPLILAFAAMLALAFLAGCGQAAPAAAPSDPAAAPLTVDRAGNPITPPEQVERIIALSPAITQTLINLGLAGKLVAVDMNSAVFEGIPADLPIVDMLSPDGELLLTLNADLALCSAMTGYDGSEPLKLLADSGVCVAAIPSSDSIEGIKQDLVFIAGITRTEDKGAEIVAGLESGIRAVEDAIGAAEKKSVYFEIAAAPAAYSFGAGTFMNEMIEIAGGRNIFADIDGWLAVSEEQVIARDPDVIFTNVVYLDAPVDEILSRASLQEVTAVAQGQVFFVDNFSSSLANEYILTAIRQMAAALHPDLWPNS
jgi:iron complex transport system substrate-binding protein